MKLKTFLKKRIDRQKSLLKGRRKKWRRADGALIRVCDMSTSHLVNAFLLLTGNRLLDNPFYPDSYKRLMSRLMAEELTARHERNGLPREELLKLTNSGDDLEPA